MANLINKALDFIFPPICGICGKQAHNYLCGRCKDILSMRENNLLVKNTEQDFFFWLFNYDEIRDLILKYKFNECSYFCNTLSELILCNKKAVEILKGADYIIPVPIHRKRLNERGYNQCELIAKNLANSMENLECLSDILGKRKNIVPQSTLKKEQRIINIKDAFYIKKAMNLNGKKVVLFDDIYTTGSTAHECIRALKTLGCKEICIFTIAKK